MKIRDLLSKIENKEILVPEFQREYVWNRQQAKDLLVSLYNEWPTGSLLFWKIKKNEAPPIKKIKFDADDTDRIDIILDGQQRLTALYLLVKGEVPPYYDLKDITHDPRNLYFNIITEHFQYYQKSIMKGIPSWNSVIWYYNANEADINKIDEKIEKRRMLNYSGTIWRVYTILKARILDHEYPIQTIPEKANELEAITIFEKINTQGTKLTSEELALAHIQHNWKNARRYMKEYLEEVKKKNYNFNLSFFVRCLAAVVKGSGRPVTLHEAQENELMEGWDGVKLSLDYLIKILPVEAYIDSDEDLISSRTLVPMVAFLSKNNYHFTPQQKNNFFRWFYLATLWSRYSSSPISRLDSDVRAVTSEINPFPKLMELLKRQRPILRVSPKDLERMRINTGLGKMVLIVAKHNKAIDWFVGTPLSGVGAGKYSIELHHIFPSSILYREKYSTKNMIERDKVNEIANKAFLTMKTNRKIRNSRPIHYLEQVINKFPTALESQFVPMNRNLWKIENYEEFLAERRRIISKAINDFIDSFDVNRIDKLNLDSLLRLEEGQHLEFKSTLRIDIEGKGLSYNIIEEQVLKTIVAFLNQDAGGVLIIGVDDDKNLVGLEPDYETLKRSNRDGFLLHLTNIIASRIGKEFLDNIDVKFEKMESHDIAIIKIQKARTFVSFNDRNYVRTKNQTIQLKPAEAAEYIIRVWR